MREFTIKKDNEGQRLDKFLFSLMPNAGFGFLHKMLRKKNITLNGKKADGKELLVCGDIIKIFFKDETFLSFSGSQNKECIYDSYSDIDYSKLKVVYEDNEKIVVDKPFGVLSQKAKNTDISINEIIIAYLIGNGLSLSNYQSYKPSVVNRLDRNTGGLITAAKTRPAAVRLTDDIKNKNIRRIYNVLVHGSLSCDDIISGMYTKNSSDNTAKIILGDKGEGELVKTRFKSLSRVNNLTLVECELLTGKSHQIRAMMKALGFPVLGDKKYGNRQKDLAYKLSLPGQYLFAKQVIFKDSTTVEVDLPEAFKAQITEV